jgi:hypothetical protein
LFHDFLQGITKLVCKTDRQALVSLIKYPATGLQPQHVWMRMFSASETNQVRRKDRVSVAGWLPDFGTFVYGKVIISA